MTARGLLRNPHTRGVTIEIAGRNLLVGAPKGVLTADVAARLREHKPEILAILAQIAPEEMARTAGSSPRPFVPDPEDVLIVRERLAPSGVGWVVITSEALGCECVVWVRAKDVELPASARSLVRYTLAELERIEHASPEVLRRMHMAKVVFGGEVIEFERRETS